MWKNEKKRRKRKALQKICRVRSYRMTVLQQGNIMTETAERSFLR